MSGMKVKILDDKTRKQIKILRAEIENCSCRIKVIAEERRKRHEALNEILIQAVNEVPEAELAFNTYYDSKPAFVGSLASFDSDDTAIVIK